MPSVKQEHEPYFVENCEIGGGKTLDYTGKSQVTICTYAHDDMPVSASPTTIIIDKDYLEMYIGQGTGLPLIPFGGGSGSGGSGSVSSAQVQSIINSTLINYVKVSDLPNDHVTQMDLMGYATETYVKGEIAKLPASLTMTDVQNAINAGNFLTKLTADSLYTAKGDSYTKAEADALFALKGATSGTTSSGLDAAQVQAKIDNSLSGYVKTSDLPTNHVTKNELLVMDLASKQYVQDEIAKIPTGVSMTDVQNAINSSGHVSQTELAQKNYASKTDVNTSISTATADMLTATSASSIYATKAQLTGKADASNVYTKSDTYSKTEVDAAISTAIASSGSGSSTVSGITKDQADTYYADKNHTHSNYATTTDLAKKADASNVYTKTEIDTKISSIPSGVSSSYVTTAINNALTDYTTTTNMNTALSKKADSTNVYSKSEIDNKLANLPTGGSCNCDLSLYALKEHDHDAIYVKKTDYATDKAKLESDITKAQNDATAAKTTANTAKTTAEAAKTTAETAQSTAETAKSAAETAQTTATAAQTAAATAQTTATTAQSTATAAKTTAEKAATDAATAQTTATSAATAATKAQNTADSAKTAADDAQKTADAAKSTAETAVQKKDLNSLIEAYLLAHGYTLSKPDNGVHDGSYNDLATRVIVPRSSNVINIGSIGITANEDELFDDYEYWLYDTYNMYTKEDVGTIPNPIKIPVEYVDFGGDTNIEYKETEYYKKMTEWKLLNTNADVTHIVVHGDNDVTTYTFSTAVGYDIRVVKKNR